MAVGVAPHSLKPQLITSLRTCSRPHPREEVEPIAAETTLRDPAEARIGGSTTWAEKPLPRRYWQSPAASGITQPADFRRSALSGSISA